MPHSPAVLLRGGRSPRGLPVAVEPLFTLVALLSGGSRRLHFNLHLGPLLGPRTSEAASGTMQLFSLVLPMAAVPPAMTLRRSGQYERGVRVGPAPSQAAVPGFRVGRSALCSSAALAAAVISCSFRTAGAIRGRLPF